MGRAEASLTSHKRPDTGDRTTMETETQ